MKNEPIRISLTELMNYVNQSGTAKITVVEKSKANHETEYAAYKDYWLKLRESIKDAHKRNLPKDSLVDIVDQVNDDKKDNYARAVSGYCKFWGKKKIEWVKPPQKTWMVGDIKIELNPELGLRIKNKTCFIKLFIRANETMNKHHADLILSVMEHELRDKVESDAVFMVLDVNRGKAFEYKNNDPKLFILMKNEAISFGNNWKEL